MCRASRSLLVRAVVLTVMACACCGGPAPSVDAAQQPDAATLARQAELSGSSVVEQPTYIPTTDLRGVIREAGPLMYVILLCSFLLVTFVLERLISLRRSRVIPKPFITRFLEQLRDGQLDRRQALELCDQNQSPVSQVFAGAVRKWGRSSVEIEQGVIDAGERATYGLRRYLRVFHALTTVGPLLGLMGTVLGMIQTFNMIASADGLGRTELLAGGIAKALLSTAGGLAVAIPASVFYMYFVSRIDRLVIEIDKLAQEVVNLISADGAQERKKKTPVQSRAA
jgi:biopolymer transport protein ExbB